MAPGARRAERNHAERHARVVIGHGAWGSIVGRLVTVVALLLACGLLPPSSRAAQLPAEREQAPEPPQPAPVPRPPEVEQPPTPPSEDAEATAEKDSATAEKDSATAEKDSATAEEELRRLQEELQAIEDRKRDAMEEIEQRSRESMRQLEQRIEEAKELARERRREAEQEAREASRAARDERRTRLRHTDQKFSIGSTVRVREGEVASDIFALGGSVKIDGEVDGSVTAIGGDVKIDGKVRSDVFAMGDIELGPEADVGGDVTSLGGEVDRADGARVGGRVSETGIGGHPGTWVPRFGRWEWNDGWRGTRLHWGEWAVLFWGVAKSTLLLVLCSLIAIVLPGALDRISGESQQHFWKALLMGLALVLLLGPGLFVLVVLLVLTIIGIPIVAILVLLSPFLLLLLFLAALFGYAGVALVTGRWLGLRFGWGLRGRLVPIAVGVLAIQGLSLSGDLLDAIGIPFFIHGMFGLSGFVVKVLAWMVGLGAVLLTTMGGREAPGLPPLPR